LVALIGPNGAGKSTLLQLMLGLLPLANESGTTDGNSAGKNANADKDAKGSKRKTWLHGAQSSSGEIKLFGERVQNFRAWGKIGYVPQKIADLSTKFPITVAEVVGLQAKVTGGRARGEKKNGKSVGEKETRRAKSEQRASAVEKTLRELDLWDKRQTLLQNLSGGWRQRTFLARALVGEPELLILDEPTVGVDERARHDFYQLLATLNAERHTTVILVTHDVHDMALKFPIIIHLDHQIKFCGGSKHYVCQ
jgi:zinc transport system ATP-binding protein